MSYQSGTVHGGAATKRTKRVFLASGTAYEGYAVCYNWDAVDVNAENEAVISAPIANWCDARNVMVEAPSYLNNMHFAGVVDKASDGIVGPNWILIHEPGSICNIYTASAISVGSGGARNTGNTLTFTISHTSVAAAQGNNAKFVYSGLPGEGTASIMAEGAASVPSDTYLKMAKLQTGEPSGGVFVLGSTATVSCMQATTMVHHGRVMLTEAIVTAAAAFISIGAGTFVGQRLIFSGVAAAATAVLTLDFYHGYVPNLSAEYLGATPYISANHVNLTAAGSWADLEWDGEYWNVLANVQTT